LIPGLLPKTPTNRKKKGSFIGRGKNGKWAPGTFITKEGKDLGETSCIVMGRKTA